jgi:hypothetical protein
MPSDLWCKSDPIVKITTERGHARLRILLYTDAVPSPTPDQTIMELSVPANATVVVLKEQDDPNLPVAFSVDKDVATDTSRQLPCSLYVEVPEELADTVVRVVVENQHHEYLATATIGPDGDDDDDGYLTLSFVVTLKAEFNAEEHANDAHAANGDNWPHPATSTWS